MSVTIEQLIHTDENPFRLTLSAGKSGTHHVVSWIYMVEDELIVSCFKGGELAVTTGMKQAENDGALLALVKALKGARSAGLIVNTGKFVFKLPQEVREYCDANDFPLLTMPWEIAITEMTQSFCVKIIDDRQYFRLHDKAIRDAVLHHDNEEEYRDILSSFYQLESSFVVMALFANEKSSENSHPLGELPTLLETRLLRMKRLMQLPKTVIGIVQHENLFLLIINGGTDEMVAQVRGIILENLGDVFPHHQFFLGVGIKAANLSEIHRSYQRAITALRMALYRDEAVVEFDHMGFYKILFSVKEDEILYGYAEEQLRGLDALGDKRPEYIRLLKAYIRNDRSLEATAEELFMHRNTVNYRINKLRELLGSPLKTLDDFFPLMAALSIRDMRHRAAKTPAKDLHL